jgi:hypothetical protein
MCPPGEKTHSAFALVDESNRDITSAITSGFSGMGTPFRRLWSIQTGKERP